MRAIILLLLWSCALYLSGMATERLRTWYARPSISMEEREVTGLIPVLRITDLEGSVLVGEVLHQPVRLALGKDIWQVWPGETWRYSLGGLMEGGISDEPYVAEEGGRYFYPSESREGSRIPIEKRVYFSTPSEASTAGYIRGSRSMP